MIKRLGKTINEYNIAFGYDLHLGQYQPTLEELSQGLEYERGRFLSWIKNELGQDDVRVFLQLHTVMDLGLAWDKGRPIFIKRDRWQSIAERAISYVDGDYELCHQKRTDDVDSILKKLQIFDPEFMAETIFIPGLQIRFCEPENPIYDGPVQIRNFDEEAGWASDPYDVQRGINEKVSLYLDTIPVKDLSLSGNLKQLF